MILYCRPRAKRFPLYLLQKRDPWVEPNPGMWITFGGYYTTPTWKPEAMAYRILYRELLPRLPVHGDGVRGTWEFEFAGTESDGPPGIEETILYVAARIPFAFGEWTPVLHEGAGMAWFTPLELDGLDLFRADARVLNEFNVEAHRPTLAEWLSKRA